MTTVRKIALEILNKCTCAEQYSNIALDTALKRAELSSADRALLTVLVYGTIERQLTLDHWIARLSDTDFAKIDIETKNLLRLGLYQLAYLDRIPDHAAVNETVALAPRRTRGFINAVLRAFLRAGKALPMPEEPIEYMSVRYSVAPAVCRGFITAFGYERTGRILEGFAKQPPLTLRTNTLRITRDDFLKKLCNAGFDASQTLESRSGVMLPSAPIASLPGFSDGLFFVQDEASQLCVEALDARTGMTVLDICACPGSKSFGAAIDMENCGRVISCDLHRNKLSLVERSAERLGISIIETEARDGREPKDEWLGQADRVLCDVPCSGFGVLAKKPELRYKDPDVCAALPDIQLAIVENACLYVKAGGLLVYSTCTLLPRENGENVARFLERNSSFSLLRERTLYPDVDGTDGFYFAVLKRNL